MREAWPAAAGSPMPPTACTMRTSFSPATGCVACTVAGGLALHDEMPTVSPDRSVVCG